LVDKYIIFQKFKELGSEQMHELIKHEENDRKSKNKYKDNSYIEEKRNVSKSPDYSN